MIPKTMSQSDSDPWMMTNEKGINNYPKYCPAH